MAEKDADLGTANDKLLKKIRQRYRYGLDKWSKNREEGQKNMRYVAGDPWDDADKKAREGRPTVCADELNQYVNQVVNTARQNPRGIKVDPAGDEATEKLAEYRENRIRAIEYGCNAAQVYINGLQGAVERNLGFWKVSRSYVSDDSDEQEILVLPIMNPDAILIDPDFKELDGGDISWAFELDRMTIEDFEEEYPNAEKKSFIEADFGDDAQYWFDEKSILVASYWEVKKIAKTAGKRGRTVQARTIQQYVTNGVEILRKGDVQPGPYIPIVPVLGKELWVDYGSGAERVLISLVSLARDPQKALCYVLSSMIETCGQVSKPSYVGAVGQFETDEKAWSQWNQVYHPILQFDVIIDAATGQAMPRPELQRVDPNFQSFSTGADLCRRAIQAAMGISPLPTAAQRQNQKSGTALEKIQSEQAVGSYHLVDSYDRAIKLTGRIVNNWLSETDLGETSRPVRLADGKHKLVKINTDAAVMDGDHEYHFPIADDKGRYQVTISAGISDASTREKGEEFLNNWLPNLKNIPLSPQQMSQILALGVRLQGLGPIGDQIADIISPQGQNQQMQQQMAQMQQQLAQLPEMQAALQKLLLEKQGKVIEMQGKAQIEQIKQQTSITEANLDRETKIAVAEIGTKAQVERERTQVYSDLESQFHAQSHELGLQKDQQGHDQQMAQVQAQQQAALTAQQGQQASQQSAQDAAQQGEAISVGGSA